MSATRRGNPRYRVEAYIDMPAALASADLVISRSGASTVAEITAVGLPSILFPYPHAYADHQTTNAECLVDPGAAVLCEDASTMPEELAGIIADLRGDPISLRRWPRRARPLANRMRPNASPRSRSRLQNADCGMTEKLHYHLIGIGGVGMSAIAHILHGRGEVVTGSDRQENDVTRRLRAEGIEVSIGHSADERRRR